MRLVELTRKKYKCKYLQHTIEKRPQAMEQTTNHKAAPLPGVFLGEESILYTTGKNIRCESIAGVFFCLFLITAIGILLSATIIMLLVLKRKLLVIIIFIIGRNRIKTRSIPAHPGTS